MTKFKINLLSVYLATLGFSAFANAQCAENVQIEIGALSQPLTEEDTEFHIDDLLGLNTKYEIAKNVLENKTHALKYSGTQSNGVSRKCFYLSVENPNLQAELKQNGRRALELKLILNVDKNTTDPEYDIYDNQILVTKKLSRSRSLLRGSTQFSGTLKSRNHYYYSCGFLDCTYTNDTSDPLANSHLSVLWN